MLLSWKCLKYNYGIVVFWGQYDDVATLEVQYSLKPKGQGEHYASRVVKSLYWPKNSNNCFNIWFINQILMQTCLLLVSISLCYYVSWSPSWTQWEIQDFIGWLT